MAAGTVWLDKEGNILIGRPEYNSAEEGKWSIPGGVVEEYESPFGGAIREAMEEIGCRAVKSRIIGVHYRRAQGARREAVQCYFFGGVFSDEEKASLSIPPSSEWKEFRFASAIEAKVLLSIDLAVCVDDFIKAITENTCFYKET